MTVCQVYAVDKAEVSWCQKLIITSSSAAAPCIIPKPTVAPNNQLARHLVHLDFGQHH